MVEYSDSVSGQTHVYRYDALGRRIGKIVDANGPSAIETCYMYFGDRVLEERNGLGNLTASYAYGLYIDEVVSVTRGGTTHYYHYDDQYNTTAVTDAAGQVLEWYGYDDFGRPVIYAPDGVTVRQDAAGRPLSAIGNTRLFNGREYDFETGLYYYRTRYLDPATGRFTTRDTIGIWGDPANLGNGYTYVGNNPWTFLDPMGLGRDWQPLTGHDGAQWRDVPHEQRSGYAWREFRIANPSGGYTPLGTALVRTNGAPDAFDAAMDGYTRSLKQGLGQIGEAAQTTETVLKTAMQFHPLTDVVEGTTGQKAWEPATSDNRLTITGQAIAIGGAACYALKMVDKANDARRAAGALEEATNAHHVWPMYLGGPAKQALEDLPANLHRKYHGGLDRLLPRQYGTDYYRSLSPQQQAEHFEIFRKYTVSFDKEHGTRLWDAVRQAASAGG